VTDFRPMLAIASTGASGRHPVTIESLAGGYVFDLKLDGIRCWATRVGDEPVVLRNRHGVDITFKFPEIATAFNASPAPGIVDGEIVTEDGSFESVLVRDKQERPAGIARAATQHPARFVAFDMPTAELLRSPWWIRRRALENWAEDVHPLISLSPYSDRPDFIRDVAGLGMEGVIAKRKASRYHPGKRSADWIKFKLTHRITCLVRGYNRGTGSRKHFGAMRLVLLDSDQRFVDVGTVGSGFTSRQTHELKARLDAGEVLVVEIEALNVTSGGLLRFPVYKGIRLDVAPIDCTIDQLATLPRC